MTFGHVWRTGLGKLAGLLRGGARGWVPVVVLARSGATHARACSDQYGETAMALRVLETAPIRTALRQAHPTRLSTSTQTQGDSRNEVFKQAVAGEPSAA